MMPLAVISIIQQAVRQGLDKTGLPDAFCSTYIVLVIKTYAENTELEFLKSLWVLGTEEEEGNRTGPPCYIGWRIHSLESIPRLLKRLKIRALSTAWRNKQNSEPVSNLYDNAPLEWAIQQNSEDSVRGTHCKCTAPKIRRNKYFQKWNCVALFSIYTFIYICERCIFFLFMYADWSWEYILYLYIPTISPQKQYSNIDRPIVGYINRSQIHECRNWERGRTVSFMGSFVWTFRCSANMSKKRQSTIQTRTAYIHFSTHT
jgi:hypothetical protein